MDRRAMEAGEMRKYRLPLDRATADRMAAGSVQPADAPPGYQRVAALLTEVAAASEESGAQIEERLLGDMVLAIEAHPTHERTRAMSSHITAKVAAVIAAATFATVGTAAAVTGSLPSPAQDAVSGLSGIVDLDLSEGDDVADGATDGALDEVIPDVVADGAIPDGVIPDIPAPAEQDGSGPDEGTTGHDSNPTDADAHGAAVSDEARNTDAEGRDKGMAVSETARAGHGAPDSTPAAGTPGEDAGASVVAGTPAATAPAGTPGEAAVERAGASDRATQRAGNAPIEVPAPGRP